MPDCITCGGEEYELIDGLYYCSICQTQSQDLREEEVDDDEEMTFSHHLVIKEDKPKQTKQEKYKGRPWHTPELWTVIIKAQVEALIKLGADPRLKDVVLRMWVLYLSKCGLAFSKDKDPLRTSLTKDRDISLPLVSDPTVHDTKLSRTMKKKWESIMSLSKINEKMENENLKKSLHGEEFYEGDNPFDKADCTGTSVGSKSDDIEMDGVDGTEKGKGSKKKITRNERVLYLKSPEWLTPKRAAIFCYLGLMYLHDSLAPIDYIRWLDSGKIPCRKKVIAFFPEDMRMSGTDFNNFIMQDVPCIARLRKEAGLVSEFLGIKGSKSVDLPMFCSRYITELKLPGEFHHLVRILLQLIPYKPRIRRLMHIARFKDASGFSETEILSMAIVVMLLKLIFVLDDIGERKFTDYARDLQKIYGNEIQLFIFEDWLHYMEYCMENAEHEHFPQDIHNITRIRDIGPYIQQYEQEQDHMLTYAETNISKQSYVGVTKSWKRDVLGMLQGTVTNLKERFEYHYTHGREQLLKAESATSSDSRNRVPGISQPPSVISMFEESMNEQQRQEKENKDCINPVNIAADKFKKSSVRYILQKDFIADLGNEFCGEEQTNVRSGHSGLDSSMDEFDVKSNEDIHFSQSEFITSTQNTPVHVDNQVKVGEPSNLEVLKPVKILQEKLESLKADKKYWFRVPNTKKPRSYNRVLRLCSNMIGCNVDKLDDLVFRAEKMYLEKGCKTYSSKKVSNFNYTKMYFEVPEENTENGDSSDTDSESL